jgi:CPA1 family monovalent cation:H+ antiporter
VTVGIYMGWHTPELTTPITRLQGQAIWEVLIFLLNALLFLLVGLQLPSVIDGISGHSAGQLIGWGLLISAVVIGVRLIWQFTVVYVIRAIDRREVQRTRRATWQQRLIGGWAGMRGAVSLAAALALPFHTDSGAAFPERNLIIFLTYAVLLATLVGQGLTLAPLIRLLSVEDDGAEEREEVEARVRVAEAAIARTEELDGQDWVRDDTLERVRGLYDYRRRRFGAIGDGDGAEYEERSGAYIRLMYELFDAQREALVRMRNAGEISDEVRRRVERDLDLEESRLG